MCMPVRVHAARMRVYVSVCVHVCEFLSPCRRARVSHVSVCVRTHLRALTCVYGFMCACGLLHDYFAQ